jgi:hypothetical protein
MLWQCVFSIFNTVCRYLGTLGVTCSSYFESAFLWRWVPTLSRVPQHRTPYVPIREGSDAVTCLTALCYTSPQWMVPALSRISRLWALPLQGEGFGAITCPTTLMTVGHENKERLSCARHEASLAVTLQNSEFWNVTKIYYFFKKISIY